eukprot:1162038-Pelagomonas_calceolata.AAC.1
MFVFPKHNVPPPADNLRSAISFRAPQALHAIKVIRCQVPRQTHFCVVPFFTNVSPSICIAEENVTNPSYDDNVDFGLPDPSTDRNNEAKG